MFGSNTGAHHESFQGGCYGVDISSETSIARIRRPVP